MQMIPSTAKRTAERAGVGYDDARLMNDAAFNAQLGAAHLGALLDEQRGSYILTFAAYNAGGKNVKDWIDAYGDPRKPGVDPVDWIERIPFTETRNYVQRVMENLQIYRVRLGHPGTLALGNDAPPVGKGTVARPVTAEPVSHFVSAPDGLRLHVREYGSRAAASPRMPVVCLPGLARTAADFDRLARVLAADGRRVLALDYRGRGLSERDPDPTHYDLATESADVLATLAATQVGRAIFIGTSRGGLITMILAALQPALIAGAVLNDIGPVIEAEGLARIKGYVGKLPRPNSWAEAVDLLKQIAGAQFTALTDADWLDFAQLTFKEENGALRADLRSGAHGKPEDHAARRDPDPMAAVRGAAGGSGAGRARRQFRPPVRRHDGRDDEPPSRLRAAYRAEPGPRAFFDRCADDRANPELLWRIARRWRRRLAEVHALPKLAGPGHRPRFTAACAREKLRQLRRGCTDPLSQHLHPLGRHADRGGGNRDCPDRLAVLVENGGRHAAHADRMLLVVEGPAAALHRARHPPSRLRACGACCSVNRSSGAPCSKSR